MGARLHPGVNGGLNNSELLQVGRMERRAGGQGGQANFDVLARNRSSGLSIHA
jgi:hypothetical protein